MATKLGTLTLDLVAKIGNFTEPLNRAEREAKDTSKEIGKSFDAASIAVKAFGAVVAGVSISQIAGFIQQSVTLGNDIKRFSDLANSSVQEFQYYAAGAETAGISVEKFADQMKDMQDRIGDFAQTGGGPLADFFENIAPKVGVSIKQFQELSGPKALQLYVDSLQKANVDQNDFKFYMEAIISDSSLLLPLLKDGGKGFKEWGDLAQSAGKIMSDDLVSSMVEAKKNIEIMNFQWQGVENRLINNIMPAFNLVLDNMGAISTGAGIVATAVGVRMTLSLAQSTLGLLANAAATKSKVIADYEIAKAELAASAAMVRAMGSTNAETAALVANARATYQKAAAAREAAIAGSVLATAGRGALAVFGGPLGLGLTVATVAASYIFMSEKTDLTTESIANQIPKVSELTKKYSELNAAQAQSELDKLRSDQKNIQDELTKTSSEMFKFIEITRRLPNVSLKNAGEIEGLLNKVYKGSMSASDALIELRKNSEIPESVITKFNNLAVQVDDVRSKSERNIEAQKLAKTRIDQAGNAAQDSVPKFNAQEKAINGVTSALGNANSEYAKYLKQSQETAISNLYKQGLLEQGYSPSQASAIFDLQRARGMSAILSKEEVESALNVLRITEQTTKAEQAYNDRIKQGNDSLKKRESERAKSAEEDRRLREKQFQDREDIYYKYASREMKIQQDLQKEILKIQNAYFSPKDTAGYIQNAQMRSDIEIQLYQAQLDAELNDWKSTEQEKLNQKVYINELMIQLDSDMNDKQKQLAMRSLIDRSNHELSLMRLQQQQRISDASEIFLTEMENIAARYAFEREQILLNRSIGEDERKALLNASVYSQNKDESQVRDSAISDYRNVMGFEESPLVRQFEVLQKMRELDLINEEAYQKSKLDLTLKYGASYMESMLGGFASLVDENSKTYAVLFAAQKAFAVAQAMLNIPQAYSKAYDAVVGTPYIGPYIAPAVGAAAAALQVAQAAKINSVNYSGFANGGYTGAGGKYDPAGIVHKGEVVFSQADVARWGGVGNVEALRTSNGFADGGVVDTKVLDMANNQAISGYLSDRQAANEQAANTAEAINQFTINNFIDPKEIPQAMATPYGTKVFMNFIKLNKSTIRGMLGVPS